MKRVTGIGGVFFKSRDREKSLAWYREHLGVPAESWGAMLRWREDEAPERVGYTVWSPFAEDSKYFAPSEQPFMINFRVHDLETLLAQLAEEGVTIVGEMAREENGKFAWILDPDGTKIELWEPVEPGSDPYL
ncbi:MAG: VOC family protein [Gemmatimonadetes bacterium]|nr:VOC family protein [Gemmatimonadota bacterium]